MEEISDCRPSTCLDLIIRLIATATSRSTKMAAAEINKVTGMVSQMGSGSDNRE